VVGIPRPSVGRMAGLSLLVQRRHSLEGGNPTASHGVIPAKAGIQAAAAVDPRLRGGDTSPLIERRHRRGGCVAATLATQTPKS
jgi:hypothetical protein